MARTLALAMAWAYGRCMAGANPFAIEMSWHCLESTNAMLMPLPFRYHGNVEIRATMCYACDHLRYAHTVTCCKRAAMVKVPLLTERMHGLSDLPPPARPGLVFIQDLYGTRFIRCTIFW